MVSQGPTSLLFLRRRRSDAFRRDPRTPEEGGHAGPDQRVNSVNFLEKGVNQPPEGVTMGKREK
ncbi:hypothetical protein CU044_0429 [Streptomyces sp. L-9-10]|nr:hypothetical protein CU044_0429 [Streptomyces sp. L-9-10]